MVGLEENQISLIRSEILKYEVVKDIIIFGSRAKGNYKKGSDIDLAVKGEGINFEIVSRLKTILNQIIITPYQIDIVHYDTISNVDLINHIDRVGKSILKF